MALFILFVGTVGFVFTRALGYDLSFAGIILIIAGVMTFGSYYFSDRIVLSTMKAHPVTLKSHPALYRIVENLSIGAGMPMPKLYITDDPAPNAFATGRDPKHGVVCVTTGLLELLNKSELEGVIAHELSHIRNYDTRVMGVIAILVGFIALMADLFMQHVWFGGGNRDEDRGGGQLQLILLVVGIILAILSPIAATIIQLAVSRKREYLADASGALLTRYPEGLASALEKLAADRRPTRGATNATAHLFIENPFAGKSRKAWFASLFDTHPPMEERIKILRSM